MSDEGDDDGGVFWGGGDACVPLGRLFRGPFVGLRSPSNAFARAASGAATIAAAAARATAAARARASGAASSRSSAGGADVDAWCFPASADAARGRREGVDGPARGAAEARRMLDDESADIANASRPCREGEARNRVARTRDSYPRSRAEIEARHQYWEVNLRPFKSRLQKVFF